MEIKIGCDPEFFVKKDGQYVSAYGLIPGTKYQPMMVNKGGMQVDGMALEFNIDPATTSEEFLDNIQTVLKQFREIIPSEYEFAFDPVAPFSAEYLASQPEKATELGCEPDYNAWTGEVNPKPSPKMEFRTASGHIHIGWTEGMDPTDPEHFEACCMLTKQLDNSLGQIDKFWDTDTIRRTLYGAHGAFRPKPYGLEYRVLSNAWLRHPDLIRFVFDVVKQQTDLLKAGKQNFTEDQGVAFKYGRSDSWYILKSLGLFLPKILHEGYENLKNKEKTVFEAYTQLYKTSDLWSMAPIPTVLGTPAKLAPKKKAQPLYTTLNTKNNKLLAN